MIAFTHDVNFPLSNEENMNEYFDYYVHVSVKAKNVDGFLLCLEVKLSRAR